SANFGASISFVGKRADVDFAQFPSLLVTLPSYTRLDLSTELPLTGFERGGITINARLENAFDQRHEDVLHFAAPGRTILVGVRANSLFGAR
ncbi:MAG TPA: hypothetical protein VGO75_04400, partial [Gemmatimonadaceae bacterium]|nr:hypothetical protein [Gemmatimonadaceae bacterium]